MDHLGCVVFGLIAIGEAFYLAPRLPELEIPNPFTTLRKTDTEKHVRVQLRDVNACEVQHEIQVSRAQRRPSMEHGGRKYQCIRQDGETWVYREVLH